MLATERSFHQLPLVRNAEKEALSNGTTFRLQDLFFWLHKHPPTTCEDAGSNPRSGSTPFLGLPNEIHLHIFSFLDAKSLCRLAGTCLHMAKLTEDSLTWRRLLLKDIATWPVIGHLSHPQVYQDACSDLHPKLVYSHCYSNRACVPASSFASPITSKVKWLLRRLHGHVPKILMFGSGLESLPFVRMLMWEKVSPYKPVGLFPGKDGIGSGFCVEYSDGSPVNLVTLYTTNKAERQSMDSSNRINRLVAQSTPAGAQLTHAVSDLCRQADAFLLVVDASCGPSAEVDGYMLDAMLHSGREQAPVLVVSTTSESTAGHTPVAVADQLELCKLANHPWQVREVELGTFRGLQEGLSWLLGRN